MGADIINYSGGGLEKSPQEEARILKRPKKKGYLEMPPLAMRASSTLTSKVIIPQIMIWIVMVFSGQQPLIAAKHFIEQ
ncbi:MAG: hypothetical protein R2827_12560 [Bdellovibrionales bacterium]